MALACKWYKVYKRKAFSVHVPEGYTRVPFDFKNLEYKLCFLGGRLGT